jgi:tetratricopeptide (TPR) repeat protein
MSGNRNRLLQSLTLSAIVISIAGNFAWAREPLQGSARVTHSTSPSYHPSPRRIPAWTPQNTGTSQADALVKNYQLDAAEKIYRKLLTQNSRNAAAWNGMGKVAFERVQSADRLVREQSERWYAEAVQDFMTALRYRPGYVEAHLNLAKVYMTRGQFSSAQDEIAQAQSISPNSSTVLSAKGEYWLARNQPAEALPILQKAAKMRPGDFHTNALLAQAYQRSGNWSAAYRTVQLAINQNPKSYEDYITLGQLHEEHGNRASAGEAYRRAVELKPESVTTRTTLADFYEKQGDFRSAAEQLKTLADSGSADWPLINRVGKLSVKSGQPDVAVNYYRNWLDEHPDDIKAKEGLSYAKREVARQKIRNDDLISQGEAKRYAEQSIQYNPENYEARLIVAKLDREIGTKPKKMEPAMVDVALNHADYRPSQAYDRAELLLSRYQFSEAQKAYREARMSDMSPRGQMVFGELLLTKGLPDLAEEAFQQVLRMLPENTSAQLGLAKAREAKEKSDELVRNAKKSPSDTAIRQAQESLKLNAQNADAYYLLAHFEESRKRFSEAADYYYAYQELCMNAEEARQAGRKIDSLKRKMSSP